ncbi:unnamed protein product (mitochondrion) [Plasmodiophora brassicae]|uniref:Uncharacterized protein n=1 Tax=Plasmodiophora brassicae TaxID=37360 RepID=A0A3P3YNL1_PLABS|nr:unnamed protein product [Plasmodiophora brassicae]
MSISNRNRPAQAGYLLLIASLLAPSVMAFSLDALAARITSASVNNWATISSMRGVLEAETFQLLVDRAPALERLRHVADTRQRKSVVDTLRHRLLTGSGNALFINYMGQWHNNLTLLQWAAYHGETVVVQFLLSVPGILVNAVARNPTGRTPLHLASSQGHSAVVALLIEAPKIAVNARDEDHNTPLHLAVLHERVDVVNVLVNADGIDLDAVGQDSIIPLQYAILHWLTNPSTITSSCRLRHIIEALARADARIGPTRTVPLHWAVDHRLKDVVKLLASINGIDVNVLDHAQMTPLCKAVKHDLRHIVEILVKSPRIDANTGNPLLLAIQSGRYDIAELLLSAPGIDVNAGSPLLLAVNGRVVGIAELLVKAPGIDTNAGSPLMVAVKKGFLAVVEVLVKAPGIDINAGDPFSVAVENGDLDIAELLVKAPGFKLAALMCDLRSRNSNPIGLRAIAHVIKKRFSRLLCSVVQCVPDVYRPLH